VRAVILFRTANAFIASSFHLSDDNCGIAVSISSWANTLKFTRVELGWDHKFINLLHLLTDLMDGQGLRSKLPCEEPFRFVSHIILSYHA
jgi:hypothetical protein